MSGPRVLLIVSNVPVLSDARCSDFYCCMFLRCVPSQILAMILRILYYNIRIKLYIHVCMCMWEYTYCNVNVTVITIARRSHFTTAMFKLFKLFLLLRRTRSDNPLTTRRGWGGWAPIANLCFSTKRTFALHFIIPTLLLSPICPSTKGCIYRSPGPGAQMIVNELNTCDGLIHWDFCKCRHIHTVRPLSATTVWSSGGDINEGVNNRVKKKTRVRWPGEKNSRQNTKNHPLPVVAHPHPVNFGS